MSAVTSFSYCPACKVTHLAICSYGRNPPDVLGNDPAKEIVNPLKTPFRALSYVFLTLRFVKGLGATLREVIGLPWEADF